MEKCFSRGVDKKLRDLGSFGGWLEGYIDRCGGMGVRGRREKWFFLVLDELKVDLGGIKVFF